MKHQALRTVALMLSVLLATSAPAHAGTIDFIDVMRAAAEGRRSPWADMRLRAIQQQGGKAPAAGVQGAPGGGSSANPSANDTTKIPDAAGGAPVSIISYGSPDPQQGGNVETIDLGDVTGTVCDCGTIPEEIIPRGGFPLWPLLGLAGIPLFFIDRGDEPPIGPPPPPPPPPPAIPEPATLLLFGSGLLALGARARRRRADRHMEVEARCDAEVA